MKKRIMGLFALMLIAIVPATLATQTRESGDISLTWTNAYTRPQQFNGTVTGGLAGEISLTSNTYYDATSTSVGVTWSSDVTLILEDETICTGFYAGANVNEGRNSGTFTLSCGDGNMIQGMMYGVNDEFGNMVLKYDAFVVSPTPGPQGPAGKDGLNGTNGSVGPQGIPGPEGLAGKDGLNGTNGSIGPQGLPGPEGLAGKDGLNGTNGSVGPQGLPGSQGPAGLPGDIYYGAAFQDCNSNDDLFCSGSKQLKTEDYYCKAGFGIDSICLVGQCKLKTSIDSCSYGCNNSECQAPVVWTSTSCSSWCRSGNDIPETPCNTWTTPKRYVNELNYCDWV